jgi:hypothetical protein
VSDDQDKRRGSIKVTATFSLGKKEAFHHPYSGETAVGIVLAAVRAYFDAADEANVLWYLSAHDERQDDAKTLEQVAGEEDEIAFRLVKEITQG